MSLVSSWDISKVCLSRKSRRDRLRFQFFIYSIINKSIKKIMLKISLSLFFPSRTVATSMAGTTELCKVYLISLSIKKVLHGLT